MRFPALKRLVRTAKRTRIARALSRFGEVGGPVLAAGMSYQALFAIFAGIWVGFGVLSIYVRGKTELVDAITEQLNAFVPGLVGDGGAVPLEMLLASRTLDWTSIIAGVTLLWVAMNWFTGTRRAVRIIFNLEVKEYRNAVLLKVRDLIGAIFFGALILVSAAMLVISSNLTDWLLPVIGLPEENFFLGTLGGIVRYGAMYAVDFIVLVAIHRILAEVKAPWRNVFMGSAIGAAGLLVLKLLAGELLGAGSNPLLASFAVIVGLLVWFNFICRVLLLTSSWIATGLNPQLGLPEAEAFDEERVIEAR